MHPRDHYAPPGSPPSRWLSSDDEERTSRPVSTDCTGQTDALMFPHLPVGAASPAMVSPEEYASLPEPIQRKCFSSVERLRIAQESAAQSHKKIAATKGPYLSPRASADVLRSKTFHSVRPSTLRFSPSKEILTARPSRSDVDVDEHQALRFLALPSKVKRAHFTREELMLLTQSSERALGWAALHHSSPSMKQIRHDSVGSAQYLSSDSGDCMHDMEQDWFEAKTASLHTIEQADADEVLSTHDRVHEGAAAPTINFSRSRTTPLVIQRPATRYNRSNARKRVSVLAPLPLPPLILLPAIPPLPRSSEPGTETETKYYKDTDARSKLREFLTSPAKFDEALEFGFPERRTTSPTSSVQPSLPSELDDLSISHTRDEDDDYEEEEDDYLSGPRTPSVTTENYSPGIVHHGSLDSGVALPLHFMRGKGSVRSLSPDLEAGRSMTMKMTLTRSDLRAPEDKLYSMARMAASGVDIAQADPLALDPLPVCDDHTGAQGAFAVTSRTTSSGGGLKKVWKNLRGI